MNEDIQQYIEKYSEEIKSLFINLRTLIFNSVSADIEEKLWAKLPSYYVGKKFVRIIPFKDHINVEATAVIQFKSELSDYKLTPKGMLQIYSNQTIPEDILQQIFIETLLL
ncbi:DUF1801 domain-containing protein [Anaerosporobacter sp.]|uniref:DUF1801 domain-containing protein n=1 Tax=Anaerosporobacter sp. TaxID=1872529 RepID=UPI00286F4D99|nr:DUF1801 domain-containing protein [Anaerosporobacter sp.]